MSLQNTKRKARRREEDTIAQAVRVPAQKRNVQTNEKQKKRNIRRRRSRRASTKREDTVRPLQIDQ